MYKSYEIDYNGRCYLLGISQTIDTAQKLEKNALKNSGKEFPTFSSDGQKVVTNNGEKI